MGSSAAVLLLSFLFGFGGTDTFVDVGITFVSRFLNNYRQSGHMSSAPFSDKSSLTYFPLNLNLAPLDGSRQVDANA
jgi:hypothetical protein